ncbi:amidase [Cryphonectria parasitica EP155]|uniref:amidase n=1 Tax=Cryphonectria parasitica (strain ATCC 38755 / EP155) TaxID=660469 RepID=A0A9P5CWW6_CRYP1|nr:amidase [Cryphonectria parasitica EP155]KAF3771320.1 amidase [Cryphonectria parasitica EP155]
MAGVDSQAWKTRVAEKRRQRDDLIPKAWRLPSSAVQDLKQPLETSRNNLIELDIVRRSGLLTARELHITEAYSVSQLLQALRSEELTSLEVTVAYCKRAAIAQQLTSCLTEIFFQEAQERARHLDNTLRERGQPVGPLHGLPISIKDSFQVRGVEATLGFVDYLDHGPSQENSCLVDVLLAQGAVLFCKTNIPQTLMTADSDNNVFGRTLNPWNTSLTAGGSSGGEGALVAFRGSPLGVGTDVAGSIRIPSLCCGLYGLKPTASRVPYGKQAPLGDPGLHTVTASAGPLSHDLNALEIFMQAVLDARPALLDATALDIPWRHASTIPPTTKQPLRLGLLAEDPLFPLHPTVRNTLAEAADRLRRAGHEIVPLTSQEGLVAPSYDAAFQMFGLDRTAMNTVARGGEPFVGSIVASRGVMREVQWDRTVVPDTRTMRKKKEEEEEEGGNGGGGGTEDRLGRLAVLHVKRAEMQEAWRRVWVGRRLDAVVGPGAQSTAVEHDQYGAAPYTGLWNFLDYPACVLPFGRATKAHLSGTFEKKAGSTGPAYNLDNLQGAPLSIQISTTRMRDEECLAIAKVIDECLNGRGQNGSVKVAKI